MELHPSTKIFQMNQRIFVLERNADDMEDTLENHDGRLIDHNQRLGSQLNGIVANTEKISSTTGASGSQSPEQLHTLCRALLLHAQDVYHRHSLYLRERARKKKEEEEAKGDAPRGLARIKKEDIPDKASILQSCVSLGAKMLFEQRIRKALLVGFV